MTDLAARERGDAGIARPGARADLVAGWLFAVAALVFAMVLLGGATRLTDSGLSMVDWRPLMGVLPPLSEADWQDVFAAYKAYPEYQKVNRGMSLEEFKRIFWFEYAHRLLGRAIGLAFALPFALFVIRRQVPPGYGGRLVALFALGGLQGLIGWWMVKSGLVNHPDVSHFRLAVHLGLAVAIFAALWWTVLDLVAGRSRLSVGLGSLALAALYLQILLGALVAGLNAGLVYNSFPTMGGYWLPPELSAPGPLWRTLLEDPVGVQFLHRAGALVATALLALWAWRARRQRLWAGLLALALAGQVALGIATLLALVPLSLALAHQAGALALLAIALVLLHHEGRPGTA